MHRNHANGSDCGSLAAAAADGGGGSSSPAVAGPLLVSSAPMRCSDLTQVQQPPPKLSVRSASGGAQAILPGRLLLARLGVGMNQL